MRIGVLEDDLHQAQVMQAWLESAGHECRTFQTGKAFSEGLSRDRFDLLILDWVLPDTSGIEAMERARNETGRRLPVIFVTQKDREEDVVAALERGADDYMAKPVKPSEMLARIAALGRRAYPQPEAAETLEVGGYRLNLRSRTVERDGERVELTHKEFDLTLYLLQNLGRLLSRSQILESVWATTAPLNTRTVDTHISRIRNKLGLTPERGWRLSAIYQHGYRLERLDQPVSTPDAG